MKCHICGKEMHVVGTEVIQQNDTIKDTIETWRCDDCDNLRAIAFRSIYGNWKAAALLMLSGSLVLVIIAVVVLVLRWGSQ